MKTGFLRPQSPSAERHRHELQHVTRLACLSVTTGLALWVLPVPAVVLGNASTRSQLGAKLRIEIPIEGSGDEDVDLQCIRLAPKPTMRQDELPWLSQGGLSIERRSERQMLVLTSGNFSQPVLAFGIRVECGASLQREYTLLLDAPVDEQPPIPVVTAPRPPVRVAPTPPAASVNPGSTTPTNPQRVAPGARPRQQAAAHDQLLITDSADEAMLRISSALSPRREMRESERERLRADRQLVAALEDKIATRLELSERLRQLEALQVKLRADADRLEQEMKDSRPAPPPYQSSPQPAPALAAPVAAPVSGGSATSDILPPPQAWLAASATTLVALLGYLIWRRKQQSADRRDGGEAQVSDANPDAASLIEPISEADIWPDEQGRAPTGQTGSGIHASYFTTLGTIGFGTPSILEIVEGDIEEHDSAVELADIMMSFGRVQGAAQTLTDSIRTNPKQAVRPWIKLLEVYRKANMRAEYDALCTQLNRTFNVRPASWDEFEIARHAPDTLENMPHIMTRLTACWGRRECQTLLHRLLHDNRQGTRQGFPLAIVEEIILLLAILERQFGPYRVDEHGVAARQLTEAPQHAPTVVLKPSPAVLPEEPPLPSLPPQPPVLSVPPVTEGVFAQSLVLLKEPLRFDDIEPEAAAPRKHTNESFEAHLDFDLDMADLTKTLNIDLDSLAPAPQPDETP